MKADILVLVALIIIHVIHLPVQHLHSLRCSIGPLLALHTQKLERKLIRRGMYVSMFALETFEL